MNTIAANRAMLGLGGVNAFPPSILAPPRNPLGYFTLWTRRSASETNGTNSFTKVGGAGTGMAYQVTAGKTLKIEAVAWSSDTTAQHSWQFISSTAAHGGGGSGPTGTVYQFGATSLYAFPVTVANTWYVMSFQYEFAATLYPGIQASTAPLTTVAVLCREV